jgi:ketosteroid isomerase-like protein
MIIVTASGDRYTLRDGQNRIGRGDDCDLQLQASQVSRHQAMIRWDGNQARIMDLGSSNGTRLNGRELEPYEYYPLNLGDNVELGSGEAAERLSVEAEERVSADPAAAATVVMRLEDMALAEEEVAPVTPELVGKAYEALMTGDTDRIKEYWAEDMVWLVPGHNPLSGWYHSLDAFLGFMGQVGALSNNSFNMESIAVTVTGEYSADVTRNIGYRAGFNEGNASKPYTKLDIDVVHVLRWRNGKVIEGRGAIFGDGTNEYDQFWSPFGPDGERLA